MRSIPATVRGLIFILLLWPWPGSVAAQVGVVAFPNSGSPEVQARFLDGLAQLHNFEYASAAELFRRAQQIDPGFAMAYWGEAMTYNHPVWMEQDTEDWTSEVVTWTLDTNGQWRTRIAFEFGSGYAAVRSGRPAAARLALAQLTGARQGLEASLAASAADERGPALEWARCSKRS